mgnify:CR=1 FL=1
MYNLILLIVAAASCVAAVLRWRVGPFLMVVVGFLQDPIRKITPGTPAYLLLPAACVWACTILGAIRAHDLSFQRFRIAYPRLSSTMMIFGFVLTPSVITSATYGPSSWQITVVGLFVYGSLLIGMVVGTFSPLRTSDIKRFMAWYATLAVPVLGGGFLEKLGIEHPVIGTSMMGHSWVTYRMGSEGVRMLAGFLRSPDANGWHAATATMFALTLVFAFRRPIIRLCFAAIAVWAFADVLLCARRKMLAMIPVFAVVFVLLHVRHLKARYAAPLIALMLVVASMGASVYGRLNPGEESEAFLLSTAHDARERILKHGWRTVVGTYRQAGFFGYGIGMATQGVHNIEAERPRIWQEAGLSKLMAEVGIVGTLGFLLLTLVVASALWRDLQRVRDHQMLFSVYAGLSAFMAANVSAGIVSAQVFGDPFIAALLSFSLGMALSAARVHVKQQPPHSVPPSSIPTAAKAGRAESRRTATDVPGTERPNGKFERW